MRDYTYTVRVEGVDGDGQPGRVVITWPAWNATGLQGPPPEAVVKGRPACDLALILRNLKALAEGAGA